MNHSITATSRTVATDGKNKEWKNTDEALFIGSKSQAQATLRCSADSENYYFLIEVQDDDVSTSDTGYLMLAGTSLGSSSRRVEFGADGLKSTKRYSNNNWSSYSFSAEVKTSSNSISDSFDLTGDNYIAEIKIPRSVISPSGGKLKVNFGYYDSTAKTTDLMGEEMNISNWIDIKGL